MLDSVTRAFAQLCICLGLRVNLQKPSLNLTDSLGSGVEFLIGVYPSYNGSKYVTVTVDTAQLAESQSVTLLRLESFVGTLFALEKLIQCSLAHLRSIQSLFLLEFRTGRTFRCVTLTDAERADIL